MREFIILNNKLRLIFQKLIQNTKVQNLYYFRILLGIYFFLNTRNLSFLGVVPDSIFRPHVLNFTNLFDSWPSSIFFEVLFYTSLILAIALILGVKSRVSFILIGIVGLIQSGFMYSFGKIDHLIIMNFLPFAMAFTNSGSTKALVPDKRLRNPNLSIAILAIFLTFGFFTAGLEKALIWIDFNTTTSGILSWAYPTYYSLQRDKLLSQELLKLPWWITEIMDYAAVLFEITGLIFLFISRKTWFYYLFIASIFHLCNTLFLNIPFSLHILIFGIWFLTPFLKKYKFLILIIPVMFYFDSIYFPFIGWIILTTLGFTIITEKYYLKPYSTTDLGP